MYTECPKMLPLFGLLLGGHAISRFKQTMIWVITEWIVVHMIKVMMAYKRNSIHLNSGRISTNMILSKTFISHSNNSQNKLFKFEHNVLPHKEHFSLLQLIWLSDQILRSVHQARHYMWKWPEFRLVENSLFLFHLFYRVKHFSLLCLTWLSVHILRYLKTCSVYIILDHPV